MTQKQIYLAVGALLTAIAWDYSRWVAARAIDPDAPFKWDLAIARYVMIVSGVLTGADAVEQTKTAVFL